MAKQETEGIKTAEQGFSKEQILSSRLFADYRDIVSTLFEDGKPYTAKEVHERIEQFMKKGVK